jgi:hypothetical protein
VPKGKPRRTFVKDVQIIDDQLFKNLDRRENNVPEPDQRSPKALMKSDYKNQIHKKYVENYENSPNSPKS